MRSRDEHNWGLVPCASLSFLVFAATVLAQDTQAPKARADFDATNSLKQNNTTKCLQQSSYSEDSDRTAELLHAFGRWVWSSSGRPGVGSTISAGKAVQRPEHIPRLPAYSSEAARAENTWRGTWRDPVSAR